MEQVAALIFGALASWLQSNKAKKLGKWNFVISFGSCLAVALLVHGLEVFGGGDFDLNNLGTYLAQSFAASQVFYNTYFKVLKK